MRGGKRKKHNNQTLSKREKDDRGGGSNTTIKLTMVDGSGDNGGSGKGDIGNDDDKDAIAINADI